MYGFPDEFPTWAPVAFTLLGVACLLEGILGCVFPAHDPLPGQQHYPVLGIIAGGVWTVAGIIWWRKRNAPPY